MNSSSPLGWTLHLSVWTTRPSMICGPFHLLSLTSLSLCDGPFAPTTLHITTLQPIRSPSPEALTLFSLANSYLLIKAPYRSHQSWLSCSRLPSHKDYLNILLTRMCLAQRSLWVGLSWYRSAGKESVCSAGDLGLIPGSGRFPGEGIDYPLQYFWASLVAQLVKNPPAMQETWVRSLGWEDPLEKGIATHSSIPA